MKLPTEICNIIKNHNMDDQITSPTEGGGAEEVQVLSPTEGGGAEEVQVLPPRVPSLAELRSRSRRASSIEELALSSSDDEEESGAELKAAPAVIPPTRPQLQTRESREALAERLALARSKSSLPQLIASESSASTMSEISLASADAPPNLPSLSTGARFKVAEKKLASAFGAQLDEYSTVECYGCEVPTVVAMLVSTADG